MRAIQIQAFGDPEGLVVVDLPRPDPAPGEVRIALEAIGVGGVDAVIRRGTLAGYGFEPGHVPGSEVAGTVDAVGAGVDAGWVGRRVWAFTGIVGGPPPADFGQVLMTSFQQSRSIATFSLNTVPEAAKRREREEEFAAAAAGRLRSVVHARLPLEEAALAHTWMDAGEVFGRIVLTVGPSRR